MSNLHSHPPASSLSVVIPIYNEAASLPEVLPGLLAFCRERGFDLVLVNDGSTDGTREILAGCESAPGVKVLHHKVNRGYGGAIKTGIQMATTSHVVTIDADGQHAVSDIEGMYQFALETDADMVVGSRGGRTSGWYREMGKWMIRNFTRILMPLPVRDINSGFKLYRAGLARRYLHLCPDAMAYSDVITLIFTNQRHLVLEYPISVQTRKSGKSTIGTHTAFETFMEILNIVMLFNPLRIFLPLSGFCILAGLVWGIPFIWMGRGVSVGSMLAIVIGLIFFVIGLIAHQLSALRIGMIKDIFGEPPPGPDQD